MAVWLEDWKGHYVISWERYLDKYEYLNLLKFGRTICRQNSKFMASMPPGFSKQFSSFNSTNQYLLSFEIRIAVLCSLRSNFAAYVLQDDKVDKEQYLLCVIKKVKRSSVEFT